ENGTRFPAGIFEAEHAVDGVAPGDPPAAILDHVTLGAALGDDESERRQGGIPIDRALFSRLGAGLSHEGSPQLLHRRRSAAPYRSASGKRAVGIRPEPTGWKPENQGSLANGSQRQQPEPAGKRCEVTTGDLRHE